MIQGLGSLIHDYGVWTVLLRVWLAVQDHPQRLARAVERPMPVPQTALGLYAYAYASRMRPRSLETDNQSKMVFFPLWEPLGPHSIHRRNPFQPSNQGHLSLCHLRKVWPLVVINGLDPSQNYGERSNTNRCRLGSIS